MTHVLVERLSHSYTTPRGEIHALSDVEFELHSGEIITVLGPSGCGKTTLLRCIAGLLDPSHGRILVDGLSPHALRQTKEIGYGFQEPDLLNWRTAAQNIVLPAELGHGAPENGSVKERLEKLLSLMRLEEFRNQHPPQLSGGMQHRVALARALFLSPRLLLLDEPLSGLDLLTRTELTAELSRVLAQFSCPCVIVTHSVEEALFWGTRILVLSQRPGSIVRVLENPTPIPRILRYMDSPQFQSLASSCRATLFSL